MKLLDKIDFESKTWKKSQERVFKFMKKKDAIKLIGTLRNEILEKTCGLKEISLAIDMRLWEIDLEEDNTLDQKK